MIKRPTKFPVVAEPTTSSPIASPTSADRLQGDWEMIVGSNPSNTAPIVDAPFSASNAGAPIGVQLLDSTNTTAGDDTGVDTPVDAPTQLPCVVDESDVLSTVDVCDGPDVPTDTTVFDPLPDCFVDANLGANMYYQAPVVTPTADASIATPLVPMEQQPLVTEQ